MSDKLAISPKRLFQLAQALFMAGEPFLVIGSPGSGKSEITEQAANAVGFRFITDFPPVKEPTDYNGFPMSWIDAEGKRHADFVPLGNLARILEADEPTVYFLDEIGKATKATQNAVAQLILSRTVNGRKIPDFVTFVCASNRRQDKAGEQGMPSHFTDRFSTILTLEPSVEDWCHWALTTGQIPIELVAFIRFKPSMLNAFDPNKAKDMVKTPTPRTVAAVGRLLRNGLNDPSVIAGAAGEAFAVELAAFIQVWKNLPNIDNILLHPDTADVPTNPAVRYALMGALAGAATHNNFGRVLTFVDRMPRELGMACVFDATRRHPELTTTQDFMEWASKNADFTL